MIEKFYRLIEGKWEEGVIDFRQEDVDQKVYEGADFVIFPESGDCYIYLPEHNEWV